MRKMKNIKISVVMPCLNSAVYIGKAIESVIGQTLKELELIIVDAGSTDGTLEIIEEYQEKDDRIHLLMSEKKSMGYQYNKGIQTAKGTYIGFVETDDFIHPQMYQKLYETAEENHVDYVKSDFDLFMGDGEKRLALNYSILTAYYKDLYNRVIEPKEQPWILYHDLNMWNGIYNRTFLLSSQIALNETPGASFQDMGFVFQTFISAQKVIYVQNPSYYYRRDNENASQYKWMSHMQFVIGELKFIWEYMHRHHISVPFREIIFNRCFSFFAQAYGCYLCQDIPGGSSGNTEEYLNALHACYEELSYSEIRDEALDNSIAINMLKAGKNEFDAAIKCSYQSTKNAKKDFFDFISNHKFVIHGLGEQGKALLALCYRHQIEKNVMGLCDNDKSKCGESIFGKVCKTPREYYVENPELSKEVYYVVANTTCYKEIKKQLIDMGIKREKIVHCIDWVQTHSVLEMKKENDSYAK